MAASGNATISGLCMHVQWCNLHMCRVYCHLFYVLTPTLMSCKQWSTFCCYTFELCA